jgi:hypothetical protein
LSRDQPSVEDIGSDRADDFRDNPKACRQGRKRGNGQQPQQQRPPPSPHQQQQQSSQFAEYQKKFDLLQKQLADQKREIEEQKKKKVNFEADLIQKICRELGAENARIGRGDSSTNVPGPNGPTLGSQPAQPSDTSRPSQEQTKAPQREERTQ